MTMILSIPDARTLAEDSMVAVGHSHEEARIIADHLIDCELRGLSYGGLPRALSIVERIRGTQSDKMPITVELESPISASIHGGDQVGYLVARKATDMAIEKAGKHGLAAVGAYETWYTGMFSYYLEMITRAGFVGLIAGSGGNIVAPQGGTQARYGTNPIAFGFPSTDTPIIWDIGTSNVMLADVLLKMRLGERLPAGLAYDKDGNPTCEPAAALNGGAFTAWGGHKGSGLAMVVQLLGMLCGAAAAPAGLRDCGFFLVVVDPALLSAAGDYKQRVADYADLLRATRPLDPQNPVRVPFERSAAERAKRIATGVIDVPQAVVDGLNQVIRMAATPA
jgi:LDH2 family malate/lactate/ureidoglycolate dehydrogenase